MLCPYKHSHIIKKSRRQNLRLFLCLKIAPVLSTRNDLHALRYMKLLYLIIFVTLINPPLAIHAQELCVDRDLRDQGMSLEQAQPLEQIGGTCYVFSVGQMLQAYQPVSDHLPDTFAMSFLYSQSNHSQKLESLLEDASHPWDYSSNSMRIESGYPHLFLDSFLQNPICYKPKNKLSAQWVHRLGTTEEEKINALTDLYRFYLQQFTKDPIQSEHELLQTLTQNLPTHRLKPEDIHHFYEYIERNTSDTPVGSFEFYKNFFLSDCTYHNPSFSKDQIVNTEYDPPSENMKWIAQHLSQENPQPISVSFCTFGVMEGKGVVDFRKKGFPNSFCGGDAILIVGSKNVNGKCRYIIRDSKLCKKLEYPTIRCDRGASHSPYDYTIDADLLLQNTIRITYLNQ